jgi:hypothetical protein
LRVVLHVLSHLTRTIHGVEPRDKVQAMSIPADTPAAVTTSPSST